VSAPRGRERGRGINRLASGSQDNVESAPGRRSLDTLAKDLPSASETVLRHPVHRDGSYDEHLLLGRNSFPALADGKSPVVVGAASVLGRGWHVLGVRHVHHHNVTRLDVDVRVYGVQTCTPSHTR